MKKRARKRELKVVVLDIDGTITKVSLLILLVEALVECGILPRSVEEEYRAARVAYERDGGPFGPYIAAVVLAFARAIIGVDANAVREVARQVVRSERLRTYSFPRRLIELARENGYMIILLSHSPNIIVEEFGQLVGADIACGTHYRVDPATGRFCGIDCSQGYVKFHKLHSLLKDRGVGIGGLRHLIMVGDSAADTMLLLTADVGVCMHPDREMHGMLRDPPNTILRVVQYKDVLEVNGRVVPDMDDLIRKLLVA